MDWGMRNRLSKILRPGASGVWAAEVPAAARRHPSPGRTVMLAVDHGYFMGPTTKLEVPGTTIEPLVPYADALMLTRGVLRTSVDPGGLPVVLRVSGGSSILADDLSAEGLTTTMKEALRLDAAAVALSIFVGAPHERESLLNLAHLVGEGEEYGMPVLAVTAVGKELEKRDARYLALACRIAAELGAHLVKTYYCDEFEKVVEGCPVPLVVAGGPRLATERDVFQLAADAIRKGAVGVDMGRNIWQHGAPVAMITAIRQIVHHGASADEALALFEQARAKELRPAGLPSPGGNPPSGTGRPTGGPRQGAGHPAGQR